jgi:urease beta subunit
VKVQTIGTVESVKFGAIRVTMTPIGDDQTSTGINTVSAISIVAVVVPEGFDGILPELWPLQPDVSGLSFSPLGSLNIFETLLPDIPGVINRGPVMVSQTVSNSSESPMFLSSEWFFDQSNENILRITSDKRLLLPGDETVDSTATVVAVPGSSRMVNVLPAFGRVTVRVVTEANLGQHSLGSTEQLETVLILRWKEPLVVIVAVTLVVWLMWRSRASDVSLFPGDEGKPAAANRAAPETSVSR